jgi:hypothetical protein
VTTGQYCVRVGGFADSADTDGVLGPGQAQEHNRSCAASLTLNKSKSGISAGMFVTQIDREDVGGAQWTFQAVRSDAFLRVLMRSYV